ncbi:MtnX-like HAD-IB family phosphatase [Dethiobacter alkaliphilus]|uniref:2,3-diketo-5-methylthio-1-phosphopentane phosphatase n=1 Tax=Dethiobacter alkaliphilus AHT 1 TaxID=555088 RepID=C0GH54_DETAL|nr:MtnX-like HAD-IB family phosphatase [Dethiobacter alkaliphilus]EEG77356.1 2,3-diketo-5-methylthio-1-phosphopentane phosphatase [Dethiobacter alkaliphilus AHT 1]
MFRHQSDVVVLCDFDGTITNEDIGFNIIQTFAGEGWHEIEDAFQRGEKGSREALLEIFALTRVSKETLTRFVDKHFHVDPHFPAFLDLCHTKNIAVTVLSDGFDFYIDLMFEKFKVDVPYLANKLKVVDCSLHADFPHSSGQCGACGNCKLDFAKNVKKKGKKIIYIGDGYSDKCVSNLADVVFAKDVLADYCREQGTDFYPFTGFDDILNVCREKLFANLLEWEGKDENSSGCS